MPGGLPRAALDGDQVIYNLLARNGVDGCAILFYHFLHFCRPGFLWEVWLGANVAQGMADAAVRYKLLPAGMLRKLRRFRIYDHLPNAAFDGERGGRRGRGWWQAPGVVAAESSGHRGYAQYDMQFVCHSQFTFMSRCSMNPLA